MTSLVDALDDELDGSLTGGPVVTEGSVVGEFGSVVGAGGADVAGVTVVDVVAVVVGSVVAGSVEVDDDVAGSGAVVLLAATPALATEAVPSPGTTMTVTAAANATAPVNSRFLSLVLPFKFSLKRDIDTSSFARASRLALGPL